MTQLMSQDPDGEGEGRRFAIRAAEEPADRWRKHDKPRTRRERKAVVRRPARLHALSMLERTSADDRRTQPGERRRPLLERRLPAPRTRRGCHP